MRVRRYGCGAARWACCVCSGGLGGCREAVLSWQEPTAGPKQMPHHCLLVGTHGSIHADGVGEALHHPLVLACREERMALRARPAAQHNPLSRSPPQPSGMRLAGWPHVHAGRRASTHLPLSFTPPPQAAEHTHTHTQPPPSPTRVTLDEEALPAGSLGKPGGAAGVLGGTAKPQEEPALRRSQSHTRQTRQLLFSKK